MGNHMLLTFWKKTPQTIASALPDPKEKKLRKTEVEHINCREDGKQYFEKQIYMV